MGEETKKSILSELTVKEAMRRRVVGLLSSSGIADAVRCLVKNKVNALLVTDDDERPLGVVSKTDIMGAYYAGLPIESPLEHIMVSPPLFCDGEASLDAALEQMRTNGVYRLFVLDDEEGKAAGALAYPDIVGQLYRFCRACDRSLANRESESAGIDDSLRVRVSDVMISSVCGHCTSDTLEQVMETLSAYRFGALLIRDEAGDPAGVISKTDLILAYKHGAPPDNEAKTVASNRVISCDESTFLEEAVKTMILSDIHRLFVYKDDPMNITGVFSLSDAARLRSGSCHACVSSRIRVEDDG
jgi:CBS domain-containing protein